MTDSDIKLKIFRTIDQLTSQELQVVYQLLMDAVKGTIGGEESLEAAYEEMAQDEQKGIRRFDKEEDWNFEIGGVEENQVEYGGYLSELSEDEYADLEAAYEEMAQDEQNGNRNVDW